MTLHDPLWKWKANIQKFPHETVSKRELYLLANIIEVPKYIDLKLKIKNLNIIGYINMYSKKSVQPKCPEFGTTRRVCRLPEQEWAGFQWSWPFIPFGHVTTWVRAVRWLLTLQKRVSRQQLQLLYDDGKWSKINHRMFFYYFPGELWKFYQHFIFKIPPEVAVSHVDHQPYNPCVKILLHHSSSCLLLEASK